MKNAEGWHPTEGVVTPDISSRFLPLRGGRKEPKAKEENPMKPFMDQDFLLENDVAKKLYHEYAENMPIYDYHCHISR